MSASARGSPVSGITGTCETGDVREGRGDLCASGILRRGDSAGRGAGLTPPTNLPCSSLVRGCGFGDGVEVGGVFQAVLLPCMEDIHTIHKTVCDCWLPWKPGFATRPRTLAEL